MAEPKAPYSARDIAAFFIHTANKQVIGDEGEVEGITHLKLQKLLYFAQAAYLAIKEKPLFTEEIHAWKFGPVVPEVYKLFKKHGNKPIESSGKLPDFDVEVVDVLNSIWDIYGKYSAAELVDIIHSHKPWKEVYAKKEKGVISLDDLQAYYQGYFRVTMDE